MICLATKTGNVFDSTGWRHRSGFTLNGKFYLYSILTSQERYNNYTNNTKLCNARDSFLRLLQMTPKPRSVPK